MKKNVEVKKKLKMMKNCELRVYKDNSRPLVFDDKRYKEKHKKRIIEQYG